MDEYLESSTYINWEHPDVARTAKRLAGTATSDAGIAQRCFEFVRDEIRHCVDSNDEVVTLIASDVLNARTGFCYAKSHLLAALLRANGIPAALCYQRLQGEQKQTLHGLNAVHLKTSGWYRIDPRGNKSGVNAQFNPPIEQLAFELDAGEENLPGFFSAPAPSVIRALTEHNNVSDARRQLPTALE